jgi:hypothetical protein
MSLMDIAKVKVVCPSPFYTGNITCFLKQFALHFTDNVKLRNLNM